MLAKVRPRSTQIVQLFKTKKKKINRNKNHCGLESCFCGWFLFGRMQHDSLFSILFFANVSLGIIWLIVRLKTFWWKKKQQLSHEGGLFRQICRLLDCNWINWQDLCVNKIMRVLHSVSFGYLFFLQCRPTYVFSGRQSVLGEWTHAAEKKNYNYKKICIQITILSWLSTCNTWLWCSQKLSLSKGMLKTRRISLTPVRPLKNTTTISQNNFCFFLYSLFKKP